MTETLERAAARAHSLLPDKRAIDPTTIILILRALWATYECLRGDGWRRPHWTRRRQIRRVARLFVPASEVGEVADALVALADTLTDQEVESLRIQLENSD